MNKLTIVVCDDEQRFLETIHPMILAICEDVGQKVEVLLFLASGELLEYLDAGKPVHIFILDVQMPGHSGIQLGHLIRDRYNLNEEIILFATNFEEYMPQAFGVRALGYLMKPISSEDLQGKLVKAFETIDKTIFFTYKSGSDTFPIKMSSILYFESLGKEIFLTYKNSDNTFVTVYYRGQLSEELPKLPTRQFFQPHKSFIINLLHVGPYRKGQITMIDGKVISISRGRLSDFGNALTKSMF